MAPERRVAVAAVGAVTVFDHLFRLPTLTPDFGTIFIRPLTRDAGETLFGGCGLNQAVAVGRLGVPVIALGVVGDDLAASGYGDHLHASGVRWDTLTSIACASGHSYILHADDGSTLLVVEEGAATLAPPTPRVELPDAVGLVCVNMPFDRYACDVAMAAVKSGADVLIAGQLGTADDACRTDLSAAATFICCNDAEAVSLGLDDPKIIERYFPRLRGRWVTRGPAGIDYTGVDGTELHVDPVPADLVDPTGAGDGVVAGLAAGLMIGLSLTDATRLGAVIASFVIGAVGAQTGAPTLAQCAERFAATYGSAPKALRAHLTTARRNQ